MANKPIKVAKTITPEQIREEKKNQALQFLVQRRETFSINILCSLLRNNPGVHPDDVIIKAVDLADKLMEKLYPIKKDE